MTLASSGARAHRTSAVNASYTLSQFHIPRYGSQRRLLTMIYFPPLLGALIPSLWRCRRAVERLTIRIHLLLGVAMSFRSNGKSPRLGFCSAGIRTCRLPCCFGHQYGRRRVCGLRGKSREMRVVRDVAGGIGRTRAWLGRRAAWSAHKP